MKVYSCDPRRQNNIYYTWCMWKWPGQDVWLKTPSVCSAPPQTPTLSASPADSIIAPQTQVILTCAKKSGDSVDNYIFYKDNTQVHSGFLNTYTITSVTTSHSGVYTCVATNGAGNSSPSSPYTLTVQSKWNIFVCLSNVWLA